MCRNCGENFALCCHYEKRLFLLWRKAPLSKNCIQKEWFFLEKSSGFSVLWVRFFVPYRKRIDSVLVAYFVLALTYEEICDPFVQLSCVVCETDQNSIEIRTAH